jgi:hypothetical protein
VTYNISRNMVLVLFSSPVIVAVVVVVVGVGLAVVP